MPTDSTVFLTNMHCPVCGEDTEADMLHDGYIVAHPSEPTLRCRNCWSRFRVGLHEVEEERDAD